MVPLSGSLRFYRSKDDIINACFALPAGVDETDGGVVHYLSATSRDTFGYRSENFDGLLVMYGHDDDGNTTSAVVETNKFADYYVQNYKAAATRCGTLRIVSSNVDAVSAPAVWDMICGAEIGDLVTINTEHPGLGGFDDQDFFVEQIRYSAEPGSTASGGMNIVLELEVSPRSFFDYNPFGFNDNGVS